VQAASRKCQEGNRWAFLSGAWHAARWKSSVATSVERNVPRTKLRVMKEKIYRHLLHFGLIHLRNFLEAPQNEPNRHECARRAAQLLHYIPPLLTTRSAGPGDAYFLEVGARDFLRQYPVKSETYFLQTADLLFELYELIKGHTAVAWQFPAEVEAEVRRFRQMSARG
jgi:hypothetical protein